MITFERELPAAFFKILWPQILVSALIFDGKLEGKSFVSSFEFLKISNLKIHVIDHFLRLCLKTKQKLEFGQLVILNEQSSTRYFLRVNRKLIMISQCQMSPAFTQSSCQPPFFYCSFIFSPSLSYPFSPQHGFGESETF